MNTLALSVVRERPYEVEKALQDGPVMIVDDKDRHSVGVFLHPDEYWALHEVAEIAKDPAQYAKATEVVASNAKTVDYEDIFPD
jgi:hypothetical protein